MIQLLKKCPRHGYLTFNEVYFRNTRLGVVECKYCSKESKQKQKEKDPEKFKRHSAKYRKIETPLDVVERKCSGCKKLVHKDHFSKSDWGLRHPYCRPCRSVANYKSKIKNKEKYAELRKKASVVSRRCYLKKTYGITIEQFNDMKISQQGRCAICNHEPKLMHIDHNHATGQIRELLCNNCNRGIGHLKESIEILMSSIRYLRKHNT